MINKNVCFKKAVMAEGTFVKNEELTGTIVDKFIDYKTIKDEVTPISYYLVQDDEGFIHQVRPYQVIRVLK